MSIHFFHFHPIQTKNYLKKKLARFLPNSLKDQFPTIAFAHNQPSKTTLNFFYFFHLTTLNFSLNWLSWGTASRKKQFGQPPVTNFVGGLSPHRILINQIRRWTKTDLNCAFSLNPKIHFATLNFKFD